MSESTNKNPEPAAAPAAPRSSLFGKLMICAFMGTVILTECLLAYFMIPSTEEVARRAEAHMTEKIQHQVSPHHGNPEKPAVEVELGDYSITSHHVASNTSLRIDFKLFGVVLESEQEEMRHLFERHQHRFRDQIIFEVRNSDIEDLSDPGLGLIKRRILEKSNRLLGHSILQEIVFSDFSFVEQ
jgi:flagellar FliL protein